MSAEAPTVDPDQKRWAAEQVLRQHEPASGDAKPYPTHSPGCAQCDGRDPHCWMLVWARCELAIADARQPATT